ncbi:MAG: aldehyde dehydrogenase family protein, partial [Sciscionella sp.]
MKDLYIDGNWTEARSGATANTLDPSDASVLATVADAGPPDVDLAVTAARRAFDTGVWPRTAARERGKALLRIAELLQRDRAEIARAESRDTGKTLAEGGMDVDDVTALFRYYGGIAGTHAGRVVDAGDPDVVSRIVHEPVGVCSLIAPWNYPLLQISWKIAPALAAGNTMLIKPSELTPLTTIKLVALTEEAGVPAGVVNLLLGRGDTVGAAMVEDPRVDLISFTGGLHTGEKIMAAAAKGVRRVALELGGKNPNVIFDDADFDTAVDYALAAAFLHSGQVCSAGSRLIVQDGIHDRFVDELAARASKIQLGNGLDPTTEAGPLISAEHRAKVERYVAGAVTAGATLVTGGIRPEEPALAAGFFLRPTVFTGCTREMAVVRHEVFGPVVTVERFGSE